MYLCIDMKSFFASCECAIRGLNPMSIPLAVVDDRRGDGALVMAATPALKAYGVPSRCRLYDIPKDIFFIRARPRMKYYIYYAKRIHQIFLQFVSEEDILVYSIDESFLKVDSYMSIYETPKALALRIMAKIKGELGLYSTCGAGDNMYLAKISLDIMAKKNNGYYYLSEEGFRSKLWDHKPITDFWMIAEGTKSHLARLGIYTMRGIANAPLSLLKKEFGVLGEEMYLHSLGKENVELDMVLEYVPENKSISRSQILFIDYSKDDAWIPLMEMMYLITIKMCAMDVDAKGLSFFVGYNHHTNKEAISKNITFPIRLRSFIEIKKILYDAYMKYVEEGSIRSIGISFFGIKRIEARQLSLFYSDDKRYISLSKVIDSIHEQYGKNSLIPATALYEKSTLIYRNACIGGHNGE